MNIDLTNYVIANLSRGPWLDDTSALTASELRLANVRDMVTLAGPLRVRVCVQALNHFTVIGAADVALQARDVYSYTLDIPPGQMWTYPEPRALAASLSPAARARLEREVTLAAPPGGGGVRGRAEASNPAVDNPQLSTAALLTREPIWGANAGFGIAIRPVGSDLCADPCAPDPCRPVDPCAPKPCQCGGNCCGSSCGCSCHSGGDDLPCDFATGRGGQLGRFFPAACEPCAPGAFVGMPPIKGPSLVVPPARGGTLRTRYFNGMFITKEDLWTDQNNNRIKHALMNRAMGQGVVWGLDVCLDGDVVCVLPGYGVDCCGNDIVISSAYRVDAQALLRDPAAAAVLAKSRSAQMNLLVEYFECPESPRPVHGDPCAPDTVSCEMSRIRETARLRLVPPCPVDDSGPIKDFLNEVQALKGDTVVGPMLTPMPFTPAPAPVTLGPLTVTNDVVLNVLVKTPTSGGTHTIKADPTATQNDMLPSPNPSESVTITIAPATGGSNITGGNVGLNAPGDIIASLALNHEWSAPAPFDKPQTFTVSAWTVRVADGSEYSGNLEIRLLRGPESRQQVAVTVAVRDERVRRPIQQPPVDQPPPSRFPCSAEDCDPQGRPRFPVPLPWLHADPANTAEAGDPKAIVLAILYALVVSRIAQGGAATNASVQAEVDQLATAMTATTWKLFYGDASQPAQGDLMQALRRLFQAWCKGLLYPGPRCECGCGPHGVVIGCARVEGGTIRMVDPWGGRRWVVHYPLLAYWGKEFGIQPLDAVASKLFDLICCIARLYPSTDGVRQPAAGAVLSRAAVLARTPVVSLGASALVLDSQANVSARLAELGVTVDRTVAVGTVEFVSRVVEALNASAGTIASGSHAVVYTVSGVSEMNLAVPAATAAAVSSSGGAPSAVGAAPAAAPSRLASIVHAAIANRPARTAVPPLLRDVSESLTRDLVDAISPEPSSDAGRTVRDALAAAGITSVAGLLDAHPEDLHVDVLNRANAAGLADLLDVSEKIVATTAKAVGDTVLRFATDGRLVSRDDLQRAQVASELADALATSLKHSVPRDTVAAIVSRSAGGSN